MVILILISRHSINSKFRLPRFTPETHFHNLGHQRLVKSRLLDIMAAGRKLGLAGGNLGVFVRRSGNVVTVLDGGLGLDARCSLVGVTLNLGLELCRRGSGTDSSILSVLSGELLGVFELGIDKLGSALHLLVNQVLVANVNQRSGKGGDGSYYN